MAGTHTITYLLFLICTFTSPILACINPSTHLLPIFPMTGTNRQSRIYEAPLFNFNSQYPVIPNHYIVILRPGNTMAKHKLAIGASMGPYFNKILNEWAAERYNYSIYNCKHVGDDLLKAIRADLGVELVETVRVGPGRLTELRRR
jgi:hypothetical protein